MRATVGVALCTVAKYLIGHDNKITTVEREGAAFAIALAAHCFAVESWRSG